MQGLATILWQFSTSAIFEKKCSETYVGISMR